MNKRLLIFILALIPIFGFISCGKKQESTQGSAKSAVSETKKQIYTCPMHPSYTSDKPGKCPICGMDLVLRKEESPPATEQTQEHQHGAVANPSGQATITITPEKEQKIGLKVTKAQMRNLETDVRASGQVAHDPELYGAIVEYQQAFITRKEIAETKPEVKYLLQADSVLNSSIERLKHLGLSDENIVQFSKSTEPPTSLIMSDNSGLIWVYAEIYEFEASLIQIGQSIEINSDALPGQVFSGTVKSVNPYMDKDTRSLRVRAEIKNPGGLLKPDMFISAVIHVRLGNKLAVPEAAVMDTGTRQLVYVKKGQGVYEPRKVRIGRKAQGYYEVLSGLTSGEQVVTSANFLIDSESKLKSEQ